MKIKILILGLGGLWFHSSMEFFFYAQIWQISVLPDSFIRIILLFDSIHIRFFLALNKWPYTIEKVVSSYLQKQSSLHPFFAKLQSIHSLTELFLYEGCS